MVSKSKKAIHKWTLFIFWVPACHHAWLVFILEERSSILNLLLNFIPFFFLPFSPLSHFLEKWSTALSQGVKSKHLESSPKPSLSALFVQHHLAFNFTFYLCCFLWTLKGSGHLFLHLWRSVTFLLNHHHNEHHAAAETKTLQMKHLVGRWVLLEM